MQRKTRFVAFWIVDSRNRHRRYRDGYTEVDGDCDDTDANANPGQPEVEDSGVDDDCDGTVE